MKQLLKGIDFSIIQRIGALQDNAYSRNVAAESINDLGAW